MDAGGLYTGNDTDIKAKMENYYEHSDIELWHKK